MYRTGLVLVAGLISQSLFSQDSELPSYVDRINGAEDRSAIPLAVPAHNLIAMLTSVDEQQPGQGPLLTSQVFDVEVDEATRFLAEAKDAYSDYSAAVATVARSVCEKRIASGQEWAAAMTANEEAYLDLKSKLVDTLAARVEPSLWEKIIKKADDAREATSIMTTDYYALSEVQAYGPLLARARAVCGQ